MTRLPGSGPKSASRRTSGVQAGAGAFKVPGSSQAQKAKAHRIRFRQINAFKQRVQNGQPLEIEEVVKGLKLVLGVPVRVIPEADNRTGHATAMRPAASAPVSEPIPVEAFRPSARARALLRGVRVARQVLAEAGGAFSLDEVRSLLGDVTRQAVEKRVREGQILAVPGPQGKRVYPTVQFRADGTPVPGIAQVQDSFPSRNAWSILGFLVGAQDALNGQRPIDMLASGRSEDRQLVLEAARRVDIQGS